MVHAKSERTAMLDKCIYMYIYMYVHGVNVDGKNRNFAARNFTGKSRGGRTRYPREFSEPPPRACLAYSSLEKYLKRVSPLVILARGARGNPLEDFESSFFADRVAPRVSFNA